MANEYWMANADYLGVHENVRWLIGEDENAEWWVPYQRADIVTRVQFAWIRFNKWNPRHWFHYWNSRRRNQVAFLFG